MNAKNKVSTKKTTFLVLNQDGVQFQHREFNEALREAKELCENGDTDLKILEVVRAWIVEYPEEPLPKEYQTKIEDIS